MVQSKPFTFSIAAVLAATAIVAVVLKFGHVWQVLFVLGQILTITFGADYLLRKIPRGVQQLQQQNCVRANGSRSEHRQKTEQRELNGLRWSVRTVLAIVVLPFTLLLFYQAFAAEEVLLGSLVWLVASYLILRSGYLYYLNKFVFDLKRRAQQYKIRDLDLIIANEEMAAAPQNFLPEPTTRTDSSHSISRIARPRPLDAS